MEVAKAKLLAWSCSLKSFAGSYTWEQFWPLEPDRKPISMAITYRFQDGNRFLTYSMVVQKNDREVLASNTDAVLNGVVSNMSVTTDDERGTTVSGTIGLAWPRGWGMPDTALIFPETLFGELRGRPPLDQVLATGETTLHEYDGQRALHHVSGGHVLVIWLDEACRPSSYETGFGSFTLDEIAERWPGDPFHVRDILDTVELEDYVQIGGVSFPTKATKTDWSWDEQQKEVVLAQRETNAWDDLEFYVRYSTEVDKHVDVVQYFELDVASAKVNSELTEQAFQIDYPEDAILFDADSKRVDLDGSIIAPPPLDSSTGIALRFAPVVGLAFAILLLVVGALYWKTQH